ncbi:hypothetical protein IO89_03150 [Epilithonimonas lactis]|uniref:Uncharacterized protein n=1 Tax=Epilithonimonas lactis TaxID=421072 RepID=A0A085BM96_9FLAO|nr:hypothetical protein IO89_03150 [Epilithonimonas lactis]
MAGVCPSPDCSGILFFCVGLKKALAKKDTAESGIKLLKKRFRGNVLSLEYCAIKNPKSYDSGF